MQCQKWIDVLFILVTFSLSTITTAAEVGFYTYAQWDPACQKCWPEPRVASNNHCQPSDCAIPGYYHCQMQDPPLAIDDDPRLVSLVHSGECQYVPRAVMSQDEKNYVNNMQVCTHVLDKMAGRFVLPANTNDASRMRVDFYLTSFKASVLGSAKEQLKLAINYDIGTGTAQNRQKATELYKKAAEKGSPFAQYAIAARYAYGISVPQSTEQALTWLKKALANHPTSKVDREAQAMVTPCAINLVGRLTPS
jgi:hypothetical protein